MSQPNRSRRAAVESLEGRRLLMAGIVDSSFGQDGIALTPVDARLPAAVARQPDGKLLVAGVSNGGVFVGGANANRTTLTLSRFFSDGRVDTAFGPFGQ